MTNLPVEQISKSEGLTLKLDVEPDAKIMQGNFSSQACLKANQRMGTLTSQTKGVEQLVIGRLNHLTQASVATVWTTAQGSRWCGGLTTSAPYCSCHY